MYEYFSSSKRGGNLEFHCDLPPLRHLCVESLPASTNTIASIIIYSDIVSWWRDQRACAEQDQKWHSGNIQIETGRFLVKILFLLRYVIPFVCLECFFFLHRFMLLNYNVWNDTDYSDSFFYLLIVYNTCIYIFFSLSCYSVFIYI